MHAAAPAPPGAGAVMWNASAVDAAPDDLCVDARPASACAVEVLEDQRSGTLADDESVAPDVERPRHPLVERAVMFANAATPTPVIAASEPPPMTTSQRPLATRRAAAPIAWVPAAQAVTIDSQGPLNRAPHRDVRRPGVRHHHRDEERRHPPLALLVEHVDLFLEGLEAPDPGAEDDPGPRRIDASSPGVLERHFGGRHRELAEPVRSPRLLRPEPDGRVEIRATRRIPSGAGDSRPFQKSSRPNPAARQDAHPGDRDPPAADRTVGADPEQHQSLEVTSS